MSTMTVRNLDSEVLDTLRSRAREEGRSVNALVCDILGRAAEEDVRRRRMRAQRPRAEALRRDLHRRYGAGTPSEKLVRESRRR